MGRDLRENDDCAVKRQSPMRRTPRLEELRVAMEAAPNRRSYIRLAVMRSLLMGLARRVVAQQFCRSGSSGAALDRDVQRWWH